MITIGQDADGVTEVSLENLRHLQVYDHQLEEVRVHFFPAGARTLCEFIFKGNIVYRASGFATGYNGEGPHGLLTAIRMFRPKDIEENFDKSLIPQLDIHKSWRWTPWKGFRPL